MLFCLFGCSHSDGSRDVHWTGPDGDRTQSTARPAVPKGHRQPGGNGWNYKDQRQGNETRGCCETLC